MSRKPPMSMIRAVSCGSGRVMWSIMRGSSVYFDAAGGVLVDRHGTEDGGDEDVDVKEEGQVDLTGDEVLD